MSPTVFLAIGIAYAANGNGWQCPSAERDQAWCDPTVPTERRVSKACTRFIALYIFTSDVWCNHLPSDLHHTLRRYVATRTHPRQVSSLLGRLTFTEKVAQLQTTHNGPAMPNEKQPAPGYIKRLNLQTYTVRECLHGVCADNVTVFPQSITLAAAFDTDMLHSIGAAIGKEARALRNDFQHTGDGRGGGNVTLPPPALACFSPQINIVRDPRWGRAQETYGESPLLTGELAHAYITGMQGRYTHHYPTGGGQLEALMECHGRPVCNIRSILSRVSSKLHHFDIC